MKCSFQIRGHWWSKERLQPLVPNAQLGQLEPLKLLKLNRDPLKPYKRAGTDIEMIRELIHEKNLNELKEQ